MNYKISYYLLRYGGLISIILLFIATQLEEGTTRTVHRIHESWFKYCTVPSFLSMSRLWTCSSY